MKRTLTIVSALTLIAGLAGCAGDTASTEATSEQAASTHSTPTIEAPVSEPSPVPTDPMPRDEQAFLKGVLLTNKSAKYLEADDLIEAGYSTCDKFDETGNVEYVLDYMYEQDAENMNDFGLSIVAQASTYLCSRYFKDVADYVLEHDDAQVTGGMFGEG